MMLIIDLAVLITEDSCEMLSCYGGMSVDVKRFVRLLVSDAPTMRRVRWFARKLTELL